VTPTAALEAPGLIGDPSALVDHPSGFLALSPRNRRFTAPGISGFVAYRERGRHLFVFGGVHALPSSRGALLDRLLAHAESAGRRVIVVQLREAHVEPFLSRGFTVNQLGTSFGLTLRDYSLRGTPKMQLRNKIHRARRAGLRVVEVGRDVPRDEDAFGRLRAISAAWLAEKRRRELDFMIGELGGVVDRPRRIFMILEPSGRAVGFITYVPAWGTRPGYLHDLTRRLPDAPAGAMELGHAHALARMATEGVEYLHFGFTPFVVDGSELPGASRWAAWAVRALYRYGAPIYPAASQAHYKLKWGPDIVEREYVAARPLSVRGVMDLLLLTRSI
jgi:lysylphosphatidylglycerol synthetase-like protein (DUF2156 family)